MKKITMVTFLLLMSVCVSAAPPVMETPIKMAGVPTTISVSSSTLTKVPTTQTSGRTGIYISNPAGNAFNFTGFIGDCTAATSTSTIRPIEITASTGTLNNRYFPLREDVCLWLTAGSGSVSGTANIHVQEVGQ